MHLFITFLLVIALMPGLHAQSDFYGPGLVHEIRVYFEEEDWDRRLDSMKQKRENDRLTGRVIINGHTYHDAGIRYKGNSSYYGVRKHGHKKLPFNIKLDQHHKDQALPGGYQTLKLSNIFRDPSYVREALSYHILNQYMPAPRANYAVVYVNDQYLGLYSNVESVDKRFLRAHFGQDEGILIKCDPDWQAFIPEHCPQGDKASLMYLGKDPDCYKGLYELKTKRGWADLIELTYTLNHQPERSGEILDVNRTLWMLAFNNLFVNLDSYSGRLSHNYYLYRDTFGLFHPIPWDMNLSFGGFRFAGLGRPLSIEGMQFLSPFLHFEGENSRRPLISALLSNPLHRGIYIAHLRTMLDDCRDQELYFEYARQLRAGIDTLVRREESELYPYEAFQANLQKSAQLESTRIIGIAELMEPRLAYLSAHPSLQMPAPAFNETTQQRNENGDLLFKARVEGATQVWLVWRREKHRPFQWALMEEDKPQDSDKSSWSLLLKEKGPVQYYFVAAAKESATLLPKRASFSYFETH